MSSKITEISVVGYDRIVKIDFQSASEFSDEKIYTLYVELMGRYSNVILTENGKVLGGNRGINMFDDGVRPLIVGKPYVYPPDNGKVLPDDATLPKILKEYNGEDYAKFISSTVQGIALSTAKEIVYTYVTEYGEIGNEYERLGMYIKEFCYSDKKQPCVVRLPDGTTDVFVYPYLTVKGEIIKFDNLYSAEEYYYRIKNKAKAFKSQVDRANNVLSACLKKVKKKVSYIKAKLSDTESAQLNKIKGELIIANLYKIKKGDKQAILDNYYDGTKTVISLDENLSPSQNAESYFKKYNKQKRTVTALTPQLEKVVMQAEYFQGLIDTVAVAQSVDELKFINEELEKQGLIKPNVKTAKKHSSERFRNYSVFGFSVKVGRNNIENDALVKEAHPSDMWFHVKYGTSSHVVVRTEGKSLPEKVIKTCAEICAYYSGYRQTNKTEIVYTEKRYVKKPGQSAPGFVTYTDYKSVTVTPDIHEDKIKT